MLYLWLVPAQRTACIMADAEVDSATLPWLPVDAFQFMKRVIVCRLVQLVTNMPCTYNWTMNHSVCSLQAIKESGKSQFPYMKDPNNGKWVSNMIPSTLQAIFSLEHTWIRYCMQTGRLDDHVCIVYICVVTLRIQNTAVWTSYKCWQMEVFCIGSVAVLQNQHRMTYEYLVLTIWFLVALGELWFFFYSRMISFASMRLRSRSLAGAC